MPTVTAVNPLSTPTTDGPGESRVPVKVLGEQDFLKLLVTKMTAQDPMSPQDDGQFIAQMAQFSSLEQTKTMEGDMSSLNDQQEVLTATGLIGRSVDISDGSKQLAQGVVQSVNITANGPQVTVNGKQYGLGQVTSISPTPTPVTV